MEDLTTQEQNFVKEVVKTGNKTEAVVKAYKEEDRNYAHVKGSRLIRKDTIQKAIQTFADRIPDDKLHNVLMEGLDAESNEKPDYAIRHKYLDTSLKLKGLYEPDEQKNINVLMPILVRFLNVKDNDTTSDSGHTNRISEAL